MTSIHNGISVRAENRESPHRDVANYRQESGLFRERFLRVR